MFIEENGKNIVIPCFSLDRSILQQNSIKKVLEILQCSLQYLHQLHIRQHNRISLRTACFHRLLHRF